MLQGWNSKVWSMRSWILLNRRYQIVEIQMNGQSQADI
jgi:hypothetical protein